MLHTRLCELFRIEYPIVSAGMGGIALAELAAAVSEAGGLGTLALSGFSPEAMHREIKAARRLTKKPLAVNLIVPFLRPGVVEALAREPIQAVTFFWGEPDESIDHLKTSGIKVIWQCGSPPQARAAVKAGADVIIAQGVEAGGHIWGTVGTIVMIPDLRDAIGDVPLIAAGGLADGRGLAAALALGADGAAFGTRFVASVEAQATERYKQRIIVAEGDRTVRTTLFDVGWPNAPHRVLRTNEVSLWEEAGRPVSGHRPGEREIVGKLKRAGVELTDVPRYSVIPPSTYFEGDQEALPFYSGQSCALVHQVLPAGEIVRMIAEEAVEVIEKRLTPLVR